MGVYLIYVLLFLLSFHCVGEGAHDFQCPIVNDHAS
jgi:hypothetical protein